MVDTAKVELNTPCPTNRRAMRDEEEEKRQQGDELESMSEQTNPDDGEYTSQWLCTPLAEALRDKETAEFLVSERELTLAERIEKDPTFANDTPETTATFSELVQLRKDNKAKYTALINGLKLEGTSSDVRSLKASIKDMVESEYNEYRRREKLAQKQENANQRQHDGDSCGCCGTQIPEKPPNVETEFDKQVKAKVQEVIEDGMNYEYIYNVWQPRVKGNPLLGKALICSRGVQSCTNTKGLHIWAQGKHGQGKSHGIEVMVILLPEDRVKDGDVSPKVLYYMQENGLILPCTTVSIDDIDLKGLLSALFKKMTTRFQTRCKPACCN